MNKRKEDEKQFSEITMEELTEYSIKASPDFVAHLNELREDSKVAYADKLGESTEAIGENNESDLYNDFELDYGDIVSIIGAGGKTSLMYELARLAVKNEMRALITTSTHIKKPSVADIQVFSEFGDLKEALRKDANSKIYAYSEILDGSEKFSAIDPDEIDLLKGDFDIFFIEADGAKRKSLKGWREFEPVIYPQSNKCIMVLPADYYGEKISAEDIFANEIFEENFLPKNNIILEENGNGLKKKYLIDSEVYLNIIDSTQGPFSKAENRSLYLYLSRSDLISREKLDNLLDELASGVKRRGYRDIKIVHSAGFSLETEY